MNKNIASVCRGVWQNVDAPRSQKSITTVESVIQASLPVMCSEHAYSCSLSKNTDSFWVIPGLWTECQIGGTSY